MMIFMRYLLAIILFFLSIFILVVFFTENVCPVFLVYSLLCFMLAYWIKPAHLQRDWRHHGKNRLAWFDYLMNGIFSMITWPFRVLARLFIYQGSAF